MKPTILFIYVLIAFSFFACDSDTATSQNNSNENLPSISGYPIVDTNQSDFFNASAKISEPNEGEAFYGQDANYAGNQPKYVDNGDGTITDMITGLMWQKDYEYMKWDEAEDHAKDAKTGGYSDWRVPTIKELYSLIDFTGSQGTGNPESTTPPSDAVPFIDTDYFEFDYPTSGRYIDIQFISSTVYHGTALGNSATFFGLNLADGRIKAYPQSGNLSRSEFPARFVRGNSTYGQNDFHDNGNQTITDKATGLMWSKIDSGSEVFVSLMESTIQKDGSLNWEEALAFAESVEFAGYSDWRLPNAKELHSLLDYSRSPDFTQSAAIHEIFTTTEIENEDGQTDYPAYWTSTTFLTPMSDAIVIFFGRAMGLIDGHFMDVHGAGAQRTDPKSGTPSAGFGPQGDTRRVYNYVRLVRNSSAD